VKAVRDGVLQIERELQAPAPTVGVGLAGQCLRGHPPTNVILKNANLPGGWDERKPVATGDLERCGWGRERALLTNERQLPGRSPKHGTEFLGAGHHIVLAVDSGAHGAAGAGEIAVDGARTKTGTKTAWGRRVGAILRCPG